MVRDCPRFVCVKTHVDRRLERMTQIAIRKKWAKTQPKRKWTFRNGHGRSLLNHIRLNSLFISLESFVNQKNPSICWFVRLINALASHFAPYMRYSMTHPSLPDSPTAWTFFNAHHYENKSINVRVIDSNENHSDSAWNGDLRPFSPLSRIHPLHITPLWWIDSSIFISFSNAERHANVNAQPSHWNGGRGKIMTILHNVFAKKRRKTRQTHAHLTTTVLCMKFILNNYFQLKWKISHSFEG